MLFNKSLSIHLVNFFTFLIVLILFFISPENSLAADCTDNASTISANCDGDFQMTGNNTTHTLNSGVTINDTNGSATRFSGNSNIFNVFGSITTGSSDYGVQFQSGSSNTVNVKSSGSVSTRHDAVNAGSDASDIIINNEGTISTSGVRTISVTGVANVTISNSGTISGPEEQISLSDESGGDCMMMPGSCDSTTGVVITNSGTIDSTGNIGGSNGAIRILGATVTSITNTGNINGTGNSIYIRDNGSGADGTIATLTNIGTMEGTIKAHLDGFVTTLVNDQGKENSNPLLWDTNIPTNTKIKINNANDFGQLAVSNVNGATTFSIATGSSVVNGTYSNVITGVSVSNFSGGVAPSGTYGDCSWSLNNSSGSNWDLIASCDTDSPSMVISASEVENASTSENSTLSITFSSSESTSNFVLADIVVSNGTLINFTGSGTTYSATLIPNTIGQITISILAGVYTDASGNGNLVANQFVWIYQRTNPFDTAANLAVVETQIASTLRATSIAADAVDARLSSLNFGKQATLNQGIALAYNGSNEQIAKLFNYTLNKLNLERDINAEWNIWTIGSITIGESDRTATKSGIDFELQNIGIGIDKQFSPSYLYGFSMHHSNSKDEIDAINNVDNQTISISSYHNLELPNNQNINATFIYSESDIETQRRGTDNTTYYYGYRDAYALQMSVGYALQFNFGDVSIAPNGKFDYGIIKLEHFSESAGIDSMTFYDQHIHSSALSLGAKFAYNKSFETKHYSFMPYAEIAIEENLTDTSNLYAVYGAGTSQLFTKAMKRDYDNAFKILFGSDITYQDQNIGRLSLQRIDQLDHGEEHSIQLDINIPF
ncbi:autotransporter domain-containing protein [Pelagibacterales bacterium]|nr:autotransporter domain-containing protein [Pelagibacterales bacterium]